MKSLLKPFLLIFIILILIPLPTLAAQYTVTKIIDGDTIMCEDHDIIIMVRLIAIDAPELSPKKGKECQPFSQQATKFLINLVLNKVVELKGYGLDHNNRLLAEVIIDGKSVNLEMVKEGLAEVYYDKPPNGINMILYLAAEREAREALKGIWSLRDKYIRPRKWRKTH